MEKPWSPSYGQQFTHVLGAGGTSEDDTNPNGLQGSTPRTFRIYNSGANLMFFAFATKTGIPISAALPGVPLGAGQTIYVNVDSNQRYLVTQSTAGTTFYATPGNGGNNGGT